MAERETIAEAPQAEPTEALPPQAAAESPAPEPTSSPPEGAASAPAEKESVLEAMERELDVLAKAEGGQEKEAPARAQEKEPAGQAPPAAQEDVPGWKRYDDALNDIRGEARAHYRDLLTKAKEIDQELASERATITGFREVLSDAQATPQQLTAALHLIKSINTGQHDAAMQVIDDLRGRVAKMLGRPVEGVDVLEGFEDLREAVESLEMTQERAAELARLRRVEAQIQEQKASQARASEGRVAYQQRVSDARAAIGQFLASRRSMDVDFAARDRYIAEKVVPLLAGADPSEWPGLVAVAWRQAGAGNAAPQQTPQPLRPRAGGGGKPAPRNAQEAMDQALGYG